MTDAEKINVNVQVLVQMLGGCATTEAAQIIAQGLRGYCEDSRRKRAKVDAHHMVGHVSRALADADGCAPD